MITAKDLQQLAENHGTPLFVIDHDELRSNYTTFKNHLPRVQAYYAVKANPDPAIIKTLFDVGASFDVSSMPEFMVVYENIKAMPEKERHEWIWDKIIYANPIKANETLVALDQYQPLVTFDNLDEIIKIRQFAPNSGVVLRLRVSDAGAMVELSSKFGAEPDEAVDMILAAEKAGLSVEGLSFHVGSQTTNFENYIQAINIAALIFRQAKERGYDKMNLLDIGGGFPAPYDASAKPFSELAKQINTELERLFPVDIKIIAEPGRFIVATAGTAVSKIIGKAVRHGKLCYYINDGVYSTFSGIIFDHCQYHFDSFKKGSTQICTVFGPTCDGLDVISKTEELPGNLERDDFLYSTNIGAYSGATATYFNGFAPAKVVHVNR
ncbi:type III PLP-dependent enzyme [Methylobacter psychrophilus]|uniref:type III PLP-dependent enzyme n=1 Tax=Methylobacter psychrophilus TaxID=96941 RepID=UPI0021D4E0FD|nr:type III PLP-dependent enzyme [Methylobacter psychrophilus]